jgi:hypothetical protein
LVVEQCSSYDVERKMRHQLKLSTSTLPLLFNQLLLFNLW